MTLAYLTDAWLVRRLPALARAAGFVDCRLRSHGYVAYASLTARTP